MNKLNNRLQMFLIGGLFAALFSCNTLDVPPLDKIGDENIFSTDQGIDAYFTRLYADLPILQFHGGTLGGGTAYGATGELMQIGSVSVKGDDFEKWSGDGRVWDYKPVRDECYFLQEIDKYASKFEDAKINSWKAEVYWIRAFRYFEIVKRYGGVPIIDRVINYPAESAEEVTKARNTEKECYDFILSDLDKSIDLFQKGLAIYKGAPITNTKGRTTLWSAYALKARVALHAASLAKYGSQYPARYTNYKNGIIGIPASEATKYYTQAWDAAKAVIDGGFHSLYKGKYGSGTYNEKLENFVNIFLADMTGISPETLFAIHHMQPGNSTAIAQNLLASQYKYGLPDLNGYVDGPAFDIVEKFENIDGTTIRSWIDNHNATGTDDNPVYYKNRLDFFAQAEPRLRASILVPGENTFRKNTTPEQYILDILYGILPADKLPGATVLTDVLPPDYKYQTYYETPGREKMCVSGIGGGRNCGTATGFYLRKSLNPDQATDDLVFGKASQTPWIELRYAEVLLTAAEAAVELNDATKKDFAAAGVNAIRDRAGAFNRNYTGSTLTLDAVRSEWHKEFYFENAYYWNMIRWRTMHSEINNKQWKAIYPIYVWDKEAYYYKEMLVNANARSTFGDLFYYMEIPSGAINTNKLLVRNHDL